MGRRPLKREVTQVNSVGPSSSMEAHNSIPLPDSFRDIVVDSDGTTQGDPDPMDVDYERSRNANYNGKLVDFSSL